MAVANTYHYTAILFYAQNAKCSDRNTHHLTCHENKVMSSISTENIQRKTLVIFSLNSKVSKTGSCLCGNRKSRTGSCLCGKGHLDCMYTTEWKWCQNPTISNPKLNKPQTNHICQYYPHRQITNKYSLFFSRAVKSATVFFSRIPNVES